MRTILNPENRRRGRYEERMYAKAFVRASELNCSFGVVSWLAAFGTHLAVGLVIACPITNGI